MERNQASRAMTRPVMPLYKALLILASTHTRDDHEMGFVVVYGASAYNNTTQFTQDDYIRAWESVRANLHMQIEPQE